MSLHAYEPSTYARRIPLHDTAHVRETSRLKPDDCVDRATLYLAARQACAALGLPRAAKYVLRSLVSCYGNQKLSQGLMVWPSNQRIKDDTDLSERTIRSAILFLRRAGLLIAVDSPNGKRYPFRTVDKVTIIKAFGFDLSPLFSRRQQFADAVAMADQERNHLRLLAKDLSAARRTLCDIIDALRGLDHEDLIKPFLAALHDTRVPRGAERSITYLTDLLEQAEAAREAAELLHFEVSSKGDIAATDGNDLRHLEPKLESSAESCQQRSGGKPPQHSKKGGASGANIWAFEEGGGQNVRSTEHVGDDPDEGDEGDLQEAENDAKKQQTRRLLDPYLWRSACPNLAETYGMDTIEAVATAGRQAALTLSISQSALDHWRGRLGPALFPFVAIYVAQIYADSVAAGRVEIKKPGGLFVSVARAVADGSRDLSQDLMALRRSRLRRRRP